MRLLLSRMGGDLIMDAKKPDPWAIMAAVAITVLFALAVSRLGLSYAEEAYRQTHNLPPSHFSFLGFAGANHDRFTFEMLGIQTVLLTVVLPAILYAVIHPVIGRVVSGLSHWLGNNLDQVLNLKGDFGKLAYKFTGSLWRTLAHRDVLCSLAGNCLGALATFIDRCGHDHAQPCVAADAHEAARR